MTLDEPENWVHAAALERGENPSTRSTIPETKAASRIASIIGTYLSPQWLTGPCLEAIGAKVVANRGVIRGVLDDLDADPKRLDAKDRVQLRQQRTANYDDVDWLEEDLHRLEQEIQAKAAMLVSARARRVAEHDPDERGADEDDRRIAQERADEKAAAGMPKGMAS